MDKRGHDFTMESGLRHGPAGFPRSKPRSSSIKSQMNDTLQATEWSRRSAPHGKAEDPWVFWK
jgi:hypothetical protein